MNKTVTSIALAALGFGVGSAQAYSVYFGEDLNNSATVPLAAVPFSAAAETAFKSNLTGIGTETFENQPTGASTGLTLTFPGSAGDLTAKLEGSSGSVAAVTPGQTNGFGRYSVPSATSSKYWEVAAGSTTGDFTVTFGQDIAAFGFYGIDIGDFGGQLQLQMLDAGNKIINTLTVNNTQLNDDGSVLYFGLIAGGSNELFRSIKFLTTSGSGDVFGFDNFTIADLGQVGPPIPEPATLTLVASGLLGIGISLRRRRVLI